MMTFASAEAISVRPFSHVTMVLKEKQVFKKVQSKEGGGSGAGGAEWQRECLQLPGAEAKRWRERKKKILKPLCSS